MKRITYLLVLLALPCMCFGNDDAAPLFAKANGQYAKANYKDAVKTYQSVLSGGYQSAAIYFNMGNSYYKLGDIPSAILYYQKARKLNPGDDDINTNIRIANLKTTDKIEATPEFFLTKWWNGFILCCSLSVLSWLSIALVLAGFGVMIGYLYAPSVTLKRTAFYSAVSLLFLGLIAILAGACQVNYFSSHKQAVVFSNSVTVKSEPANTAKTLFVIHEGTTVDVLENNSSWLRVKLLNGNEGWILLNSVKNI